MYIGFVILDLGSSAEDSLGQVMSGH